MIFIYKSDTDTQRHTHTHTHTYKIFFTIWTAYQPTPAQELP